MTETSPQTRGNRDKTPSPGRCARALPAVRERAVEPLDRHAPSRTNRRPEREPGVPLPPVFLSFPRRRAPGGARTSLQLTPPARLDIEVARVVATGEPGVASDRLEQSLGEQEVVRGALGGAGDDCRPKHLVREPNGLFSSLLCAHIGTAPIPPQTPALATSGTG